MRDDKGSTIPLYVWTVGMVLFVAFVFFVFAKGAVARSGAQSAADAAALAAAQEFRDELTAEFIATLPTGAWVPPLEGKMPPGPGYFAAAQQLAAENESTVIYVHPTPSGIDLAFKAKIRTNYPVGDSLVPRTEDTYAEADATAVVEPKCHMVLNVPTKVAEIACKDGRQWVIHVEDLNGGVALPSAKDLFSVHLVD
ncbi:pilus assembly protein TadG-related protein [Streptomyces sp. NBC_01304]|uniref:pilus assembly protein TadG-related protein n=1 Tax=Streptomyces sp. NBC_01304 TaxID=2903818 RepID=UPI002E14DFC4|nr:pilus assembly protein TadG-related protein [Streptomyces sp. NBC_01304]